MWKSTRYKNTISPFKSLLQDKIITKLLKIILIVALGAILYYQLLGNDELSLQGLVILFRQNISIQKIPIVLLVLLLMPLNWFFETKKWLHLMQKIQQIELLKALKAVMAGVAFSLFTPNRIGEYVGRMALIESDKRYLAVWPTMVGVLGQWLVLIIIGWWAMIGLFYLNIIPISFAFFGLMIGLGAILTFVLLFAYYRLPKLVDSVFRFRWGQKWLRKFKEANFEYYTKKELNKAFYYSFLRYTTYSFQYLLLLYFFGFQASFFNTTLGILVIYLLQTGIPLPPSTGLLARGNIALFVFGYISLRPIFATTVLAATFSLWIINLVLPAILGAFFISQLDSKPPKQKEE